MSYARVKDLVRHYPEETFDVRKPIKEKPQLIKEKPQIIKLVNVAHNTPYNELDGAIQWFTFHRSALKYPEKPSHHVKHRMRGFIMGIPIIIRCQNCSNHAEEYLSGNEDKIEDALANRDALFNFFVDFHNFVKNSQRRKIYTYQEAKELYSKPWKAVYPSE